MSGFHALAFACWFAGLALLIGPNKRFEMDVSIGGRVFSIRRHPTSGPETP